MRTYGRTTDLYGVKTWVVVQTDDKGHNDYVWVTTLIQCLLLNIGESPFFANYGIPAQQSLIQQIFPDFYVAQIQRRFARFFSSLIIFKLASPTPTYHINIITNSGVKIAVSIPI